MFKYLIYILFCLLKFYLIRIFFFLVKGCLFLFIEDFIYKRRLMEDIKMVFIDIIYEKVRLFFFLVVICFLKFFFGEGEE